MGTITYPRKHPGTEAERAANRATHSHHGIDGRCFDCDCRPGSVSAEWPCGARVPRETRTT